MAMPRVSGSSATPDACFHLCLDDDGADRCSTGPACRAAGLGHHPGRPNGINRATPYRHWREPDHHPQPLDVRAVDGVDAARIARVRRDHDRAFRQRFPKLADVDLEYSWGGRLCLSRNSVPAFGEVEPGMFSACCQNGLGTAKGTLAGIGAVELATRSNSPIVQDLLSYDRPVKLPPNPIAKLGATLVLRWREWRAGAEI
jgi:hypothetical protein